MILFWVSSQEREELHFGGGGGGGGTLARPNKFNAEKIKNKYKNKKMRNQQKKCNNAEKISAKKRQ